MERLHKKPFVQNKFYYQLLKKLILSNVPYMDIADAANLKNTVFLDAREEEEYKVSALKMPCLQALKILM